MTNALKSKDDVFIGLSLYERLYLVSVLGSWKKNFSPHGAQWEAEMCDALIAKFTPTGK
jgi:hypothetical protein